jgi:S1-C subfamily serine protease
MYKCSWIPALAATFALASSSASGAEQGLACGKSAVELYRTVSSSVIKLVVLAIDPFDPGRKFSFSAGSAFVLGNDGTLVTNYHVLLNQRQIYAEGTQGRLGRADFIAGDPLTDIALVRVGALAGRPGIALPLAEQTDAVPGTPVFVVGYPGAQSLSISSGVISTGSVAIARNPVSWTTSFLRTDAAIDFGNSGGPVLDDCGRVVGIATLRDLGSRTGYAIPAVVVASVVRELAASGHVRRPWLGIGGRFVDEELLTLLGVPLTRGLLVETIEPGSDAARAGLSGGLVPVRVMAEAPFLIGGDIITRVNGLPLLSEKDVVTVGLSLKPGDDVTFDYFRSGVAKKGQVRLSERPSLPDDIRVLGTRSVAHRIDDFDMETVR